MFASLSVDGDYTATNGCDDLESVTLEFGNDVRSDYQCRACGAELEEAAEGYADDFGDLTCWAYSDDSEDGTGDDEGPHDPVVLPLSWCNSAGVDVDTEHDQVTVSISVADPRGAFCFTVRRVPDDAPGENAGRLILHVPYPGELMPHQPLTRLHDGTFVIGEL